MLRIFEYILTAVVAAAGICFTVSSGKRKKRKKLLGSFEKFLSIVIKQYSGCENIHEALDEAGDQSDRDMRYECGRILDALDAGEHSDKAVHLFDCVREPFIKEFFLLCSSIRSFGDILYRGVSLFDRNLKYIKEEVRLEILLRDEEDYLFSGLMPLILTPFFLLIPIEKWAEGISADMKNYYLGSFGLVTLAVSFAITILSICTVIYLKDPGIVKGSRNNISDMILKLRPVSLTVDSYIDRHYSRCLRKNEELKRLRGFGNIREYFVRRVLFSICGFMLSFSLCFAAFLFEKKESLRPVELSEYKVFNLDDQVKERLSEQLTEYFTMLKDEGVRDIGVISDVAVISKDESIQSACEAVLKERLEEYYKVGFKVGFMPVIMLCTVLGFYIPGLLLLLTNWQNNILKQRETLQFQTLILILMHHENITVEEILRWMEHFAGVFEIAFERAVDDYSFRRNKALETLKEEVAFEPLVKIVEGLIACDDITVENAFSDIENERAYYLEQYRQSSFDTLKERAAFARVAAFLPFVTVLALRLIVPFVLSGLTQLSSFKTMLG